MDIEDYSSFVNLVSIYKCCISLILSAKNDIYIFIELPLAICVAFLRFIIFILVLILNNNIVFPSLLFGFIFAWNCLLLSNSSFYFGLTIALCFTGYSCIRYIVDILPILDIE